MEKIKFGDSRITKTVELPSFEGSQVVVWTALTVGDQRDIAAKFPNAQVKGSSDAADSIFEMVAKGIKEWNFTDDNDQDLPISSDIIRKMNEKDLKVLVSAITGKEFSEEDNSTVDEANEKKKQ